MSTEIQAVFGLFMAAVITRMSLISGMLKTDESTNATRKSPKGPRVGMRTAWIQAMNFCTLGVAVARNPWNGEEGAESGRQRS